MNHNGQLTQGQISPLAHIHPDANISPNVTIEPFAFVDKNVDIGEGTWIGPNVTILEGARIGKFCKIFPGAVIAAIPQDLKFQGEKTTVEIGDFTTIRECVTVNRATKYAWKTVVGSHCLLMAYVHVAHDCILGDNIILANAVNLAGHVEIDDYAVLEGVVAVQQFVKIGKHSFIGGGSLVRKNVPPYVKAAREPLSYMGVNSIGLTRRGFDSKLIKHLQDIYRYIFVSGYNLTKAIDILQDKIIDSPQRTEIIQFILQSKKGVIKGLSSSMNGKHNNGKLNGKH